MEQTPVEDAIATTPRRHLGTMPGDNLMLPPDVTGYTQIFYDFCEAAHLAPESVSATRLCTVPIPRFQQRSDICHMPATAWANPMFWLPYDWRVNQDGACTDHMALHITWELTLSGMYDTVDGFTDVLALMGLDVDQVEVQERIYAWARGGEDAVLDSFDITAHLSRPEGEQPQWVEHLAEEFAEDMLRASWGINAIGLSRMLDESVSDFEQTNDIDAFRKILQAQLKLVGSLFDGITYEGQQAKDIAEAMQPMLYSDDIPPVGVALILREFLIYVEQVNQPAVEYLAGEIQDQQHHAASTVQTEV